MQIYELTQRPVKEGILGGVAKAVGSAAMAGIANQASKTLGVDVSNSFSKASNDPQTAASAAAAPIISQLAKDQQAQWQNTVTGLMAKSIDPATGNPAKSITGIPAGDLQAQLDKMIDASLTKMSQHQLNDIDNLPEKVNPAQMSGKAKQYATQIKNQVLATKAKLMKTEPKDSGPIWGQLASLLYNASNMVTFNRNTSNAPSVGSPGAVTKMAQSAAASKLTAKQLNIPQNILDQISAKFPPGSDPRVDALFTALGIYKTPQTPAGTP